MHLELSTFEFLRDLEAQTLWSPLEVGSDPLALFVVVSTVAIPAWRSLPQLECDARGNVHLRLLLCARARVEWPHVFPRFHLPLLLSG